MLRVPPGASRGRRSLGKVVALGTDVAFVDVGGKGEATIDLEELREPDGTLRIAVGDTVKAIVVSTSGGMKLSHKLARHAATREALRDAYESGLPVEGRVEAVIKGGYEVRFSGPRAFCPISQIDTSYTEDPAIHQGKVYLFRIVEYKGDGKNIVVSRRALLEEEERARAEEVKKLIVRDAVLRGRVASVREYGAFVDLGGGIQGLLHVSEMGWSRVTDPASVVQPGDEIEVKVLDVDEEKGKISLGLKQLQADPWTTAASTFAVGQVLSGRVTRVADFGAFLELRAGHRGLAHVSTFPPRKDGRLEVLVPRGAQLPVEILSIDVERRRIGVAVVEEGSAKARSAEPIKPGTRLVGKVERHESYGVFALLKAGATGLIPPEETGAERTSTSRSCFPSGATWRSWFSMSTHPAAAFA
jgi:small subunit ribosomal protein S1